MGVFDRGYQQAIIDAGRNPVDRPPAGFLDAFNASFEAVSGEELATSRARNRAEKRAERRQVIIELGEEDISHLEGAAIPQLSLSSVGRSAEGRAAIQRYRDRLSFLTSKYPEVKTDDELDSEIVEELRESRERTSGVLSSTTLGGKAGMFLGGMAASFRDPEVPVSMMFGAGVNATVLRVALIEAGINMGLEVLQQPMVARYKKDIGSPITLGEAAIRIAGAGVLGGVVGGGVKAITKGIQRLLPRVEGVDDLLETFDKNIKDPTPEQALAREQLGEYADLVRESPFDLSDPVAAERHLQATNKAVSDLEAGRPVDVEEIVSGLEPRPDAAVEPLLPGQRRTTILEQDANGRIRAKTIVVGTPERQVPTTEQSLTLFVKNHGGVAVNQSGDLRGEFDALFESGGSKAGAVKRNAGISADEMAERAHEAGFIDEPDPAMLAEALDRDLRGDKVFSTQGERFDRKLDLELEREFQGFVESEAARLDIDPRFREEDLAAIERQFDELVTEQPDFEIPVETTGPEATVSMRRVNDLLAEADDQINDAKMLRKCLFGG